MSYDTGTLTFRNIEPSVRDRLRVRAARNGRSMEAELRLIVAAAVAAEAVEESFDEAAARLRASTPRQASESADLVRRDRDRGHRAAPV